MAAAVERSTGRSPTTTGSTDSYRGLDRLGGRGHDEHGGRIRDDGLDDAGWTARRRGWASRARPARRAGRRDVLGGDGQPDEPGTRHHGLGTVSSAGSGVDPRPGATSGRTDGSARRCSGGHKDVRLGRDPLPGLDGDRQGVLDDGRRSAAGSATGTTTGAARQDGRDDVRLDPHDGLDGRLNGRDRDGRLDRSDALDGAPTRWTIGSATSGSTDGRDDVGLERLDGRPDRLGTARGPLRLDRQPRRGSGTGAKEYVMVSAVHRKARL